MQGHTPTNFKESLCPCGCSPEKDWKKSSKIGEMFASSVKKRRKKLYHLVILPVDWIK